MGKLKTKQHAADADAGEVGRLVTVNVSHDKKCFLCGAADAQIFELNIYKNGGEQFMGWAACYDCIRSMASQTSIQLNNAVQPYPFGEWRLNKFDYAAGVDRRIAELVSEINLSELCKVELESLLTPLMGDVKSESGFYWSWLDGGMIGFGYDADGRYVPIDLGSDEGEIRAFVLQDGVVNHIDSEAEFRAIWTQFITDKAVNAHIRVAEQWAAFDAELEAK